MSQIGNPALNSAAVKEITPSKSSAMTIKGTYTKTLFSFIILVASAAISWQWASSVLETSNLRWLPLFSVSIFTFLISMIITFNPKLAPKLTVLYAVLQGGLLGILSGTFANSFEGIVGQAIFITFAVFLAVFAGYSMGLLKATSKFTLVIITAMLGILMFSLLSWIFSLFSLSTPVIYSYGTWGIVFSVVVVIVAALSLVLDFDFIDQAAKRKFPKYFEWYGAYALMLGLVWLYLEILRLLAKLAANNQSN